MIRLELSLDADLVDIDQYTLATRVRGVLKCYAPCVLRTSFVFGSVRMINEMSVPVAEATVLDVVTQATQGVLDMSRQTLQRELRTDVPVSVAGEVVQYTHVVAMRVAPPPPPPTPLPSPHTSHSTTTRLSIPLILCLWMFCICVSIVICLHHHRDTAPRKRVRVKMHDGGVIPTSNE